MIGSFAWVQRRSPTKWRPRETEIEATAWQQWWSVEGSCRILLVMVIQKVRKGPE